MTTTRTRLIAVGVVVVVAVVTTLVTLAVLECLDPTPRRPGERLGELESTTAPFPNTPATGINGVSAPRQPTVPRAFDVAAAMNHVRALEALGPRGGGGTAEAQAAEYLRSQLAGLGLAARIEEFPLTNGATSRNVVARIPGSSDRVVVLGAHFDSKPPSPGANDNGSGCGALLELAAILADQPVTPTIEIVFFGSEEIIGGDPNAHHFGSRYRVAQMTADERANTAGMFSIDMIGYGPDFHSRTMGKGPMTLSNMLLARARALGIGITYKPDTSKSGLSDHEAYELAGIPVSCVAWREDPVYHTSGDVSSHLQPDRIATTGWLVVEFLRSLDETELESLISR